MSSDQTHKYFRKFVRVRLLIQYEKKRLMGRDGMMELYGRDIIPHPLDLLLLAPALRGQFPPIQQS